MWTRIKLTVWHWLRFFTHQFITKAFYACGLLVFAAAFIGGIFIVLSSSSKETIILPFLLTLGSMGVIVIVLAFLFFVSAFEKNYRSWVRVHRRALEDRVPSMYTQVSRQDSPWVLLPVSLERKVLLLKAGIPVEQALSRRVRRLSDEDLRVMGALNSEYAY